MTAPGFLSMWGSMSLNRHGGDRVASVLARWNIDTLFTLCGGHISPILVGAKDAGLRVIDCRDEKNAVFAADAVARMTGLPGVAAVTAGPGVTNTLTALKNAQMAQSPVVLFGGATATVLKGRGALQDIDQMALIRSAVKWAARCRTVSQLGPTVERALREASEGVPGPGVRRGAGRRAVPRGRSSGVVPQGERRREKDVRWAKALGCYLQGPPVPAVPRRRTSTWLAGWPA